MRSDGYLAIQVIRVSIVFSCVHNMSLKTCGEGKRKGENRGDVGFNKKLM